VIDLPLKLCCLVIRVRLKEVDAVMAFSVLFCRIKLASDIKNKNQSELTENLVMKRKVKWIWGAIFIFAIVAVIFVFSFHRTILFKAGRFMAPVASQIEGAADVVIVEGTTFVNRGVVAKGVELLLSGKAKRMVVVLHRIAPHHRPFAFNEDYPSSVRRELQNLGLKDSQFTIIVTHIHEPITLVSAQGAMDVLAKDGIKSALLVSPGFHMRRSFLVYQYLSNPFNIKIYPIACLEKYDLNNWWCQDNGSRDLLSEFQKLLFYMVKGYIPLKFAY
jgi:uncharacterized SAM-binding protein YcdF (DUF218 family)